MIPQFKLTKHYSISRVLKGGWQLSEGHSQIGKDTAIDDMFAFVEKGITTFDCADIYTGVEEMIGQFLKLYKDKYGKEAQDRIKIHTKFVPDINKLALLSKKDIETIIDRSLQRLGLEQLHLVQFHWWDYDVPRYVETALTLQELQQKGKILNLAGTNFDVPHLEEMTSSGVKLVSLQVQYSVLDHRPEKRMIEFCKNNNIYLICYGTVAGGFLSKKYLGQPKPKEPLENRSLTKYQLIIDDIGGWDYFQSVLKILDVIAKKHHVSITNVATKYILDKPQVAATVIGARNTNHLDETLRMFDFELDEEDKNQLKIVLEQAKKLEEDIYSLERVKGGRHAQIMKYNLNKE